jgi:hypothetical protein
MFCHLRRAKVNINEISEYLQHNKEFYYYQYTPDKSQERKKMVAITYRSTTIYHHSIR